MKSIIKALPPYDHKKVEPKWQKVWEKKKANVAKDKSAKKKFYGLIEFPFPSGDGLHVGHIRSNTAMDIIARKRRREGYEVLYPIGWDAFGLPTENYAIKTGIQPAIVSKQNSNTFRKQLKALGFSFDWSREIDTTDPKYFKWTQWIFLELLKKGLAYKKKTLVSWCPKDLTGLANEEVIDGKCERCGTVVERREKDQWMLAITKYADRLDKDLDDVDFLERIKIQQRNWIGKSEGAEIDFDVDGKFEAKDGLEAGDEFKIKVFTTRPDTLFGVTYLILSPEHPFVSAFLSSGKIKNKTEVEAYISSSKSKTEIERTTADREKTGVLLNGLTAINPVNNQKLPIWIADYVLAEYGTGAVMAVPAHDERDFAFATKYGLGIKHVVMPAVTDHTNPPRDKHITRTRQTVHAIVFNPKTEKYLTLKWKKFPWNTVVLGGIEEGEDAVAAAIREVEEETGYTDLEFKRVLGAPVQASYFASHKNENRIAITTAVYFELKSETQVERAQVEKDAHDIVWRDVTDFVPEKMTNSELPFWLERMKSEKEVAYYGHGILVDSDKFSGKESSSVLKEITSFAGGKWVTKFKLRDWIFSRQRYWGEPIPVVHCERCGIVPLSEKDLPLTLPKVKNFKPTESGESPLASSLKWVNTKCPKCVAERNKQKYFIFDFDGVLADTWEATIEARVIQGVAKNREDAIGHAFNYFDKKPDHTRSHTLSNDEIEKKLQWTIEHGKILNKITFKIFDKFIAEVKKIKNAKYAIVSSGSHNYVQPALKKIGLKFTHVLAMDDHHSKEEKIERICKDWKVDVKDIYYFTDTKADVYELENFLDKEKIVGCPWGFCGYEKLTHVLPEKQILKDFKDIHRFFNTSCSARRETDTMPNWAGSSWYYLRYIDPKNSKALASPEKLKYWTPVDWYNGGMEHTTLHLLYSRFWHKFLYDIGVVPTKEPYAKRTSHGLILAQGGEKMSKSKGNVINPDGIISAVGADSLRMYEMFMGPFDQPIAWDTNNIAGVRRFIERVWRLREKYFECNPLSLDQSQEAVSRRDTLNLSVEKNLHITIKKVSEEIELMKFNTAISSLMILLNILDAGSPENPVWETPVFREAYDTLLLLLAPFAPHVTEELWQSLGKKESIHTVSWPAFDPKKIIETEMKIVVQVNGKVKIVVNVDANASENEIKEMALALPEVTKLTTGIAPKKVIYVKDRLINIVI